MPPGQCKSDYWIHSQLGSLLDPPIELPSPDGKYRFPTELHDEQAPQGGFPFRLLTLIRRELIHSEILPEKHHSVSTVWVAPDHPGLADLGLAQDVFLCSPLGRIRVEVEIMPGLHPEVVLYRRGGIG